MQQTNFKVFTSRMTPRHKGLAALLIVFVLLFALIMIAVAAIGGTLGAIGNGVARAFRGLFGNGKKNPSVGQSESRAPCYSSRPKSSAYDGLDPNKRIDLPHE